MDYSRWQEDTLDYISISMRPKRLAKPVNCFDQEQNSREEEPVPKPRGMNYEDNVKYKVEQVTVVEDFKVARPSHEGKRRQDHDYEDAQENPTCDR